MQIVSEKRMVNCADAAEICLITWNVSASAAIVSLQCPAEGLIKAVPRVPLGVRLSSSAWSTRRQENFPPEPKERPSSTTLKWVNDGGFTDQMRSYLSLL